MRLEFTQPQILWLIAPLAAHVLWTSRRLGLLSRARRIWSVGLRLVLLALIVGAVAGPRISKQSKDLTVFFVLDSSDSLPQPQREYARAYIKNALQTMGPNDQAGIVVFGAEAALEKGPARKAEFGRVESVINSKATNISDAVELAMACFTGGSQKRLVILSDGNENIGQARQTALAAKGSNISIDVVPLKYQNRNEVILEKVTTESRVSVDEPFNLRVIASAAQSGPAKLRVFQDGALAGEFPVDLAGGQKNAFDVPVKVGDAGFHSFEAQLDAETDLIPENNRGVTFTYGEGEPRALFIDGDETPSVALAAALSSAQVKVDVRPPSGVPGTLRELQAYDALVFNNVAAADVTKEQMSLIEAAVHDFGLGFVMIGGEKSFAPGGYNDSPIEKILPVDMEMKNDRIIPQGALVPILHTVEIPDGEHWAEEVMLAALNVLYPQDEMGVLYYSYSGGESWLFNLEAVGSKGRMRNMIKGIQPGDMPSFDRTLKMAYDSLSKSRASVKHVVVISDGDPQTPNPTLVKNLQSAKVTISTVVIAPHSDRDVAVMRQLAKDGGGNFYHPKNYNELPQIFIREATTVRKAMLVEEPFVPKRKQGSPILNGIEGALPTLKGYVGTSAKSLADVPLLTHKDDPLLAHWRHGVGRTVAFTSDAKERWATDWLAWGGYGQFWSQLMRWVMRPPINQNYQLETNIQGSRGKVSIDAVNAAGEFRNFLQIKGKVLSPTLEEQEVEFRQTSPGRYEAEFNVKETGTYMVSAVSADGAAKGETSEAELVTGGASVSYSPEYQDSKSNEGLLAGLADLTNGRVLDEKTPVFAHNLQSFAQPNPIWTAFVLAALFILLADIFARRVLIGWADVGDGLGIAGAWIARPFRRRSTREEASAAQLLKVKEGVHPTAAENDVQREDFLAQLKQVKIDATAQLPGAEEAPAPKPAPGPRHAPEPPKSEPTSLTQELLKTRNKTRQRLDKSAGEEKEQDQ